MALPRRVGPFSRPHAPIQSHKGIKTERHKGKEANTASVVSLERKAKASPYPIGMGYGYAFQRIKSASYGAARRFWPYGQGNTAAGRELSGCSAILPRSSHVSPLPLQRGVVVLHSHPAATVSSRPAGCALFSQELAPARTSEAGAASREITLANFFFVVKKNIFHFLLDTEKIFFYVGLANGEGRRKRLATAGK